MNAFITLECGNGYWIVLKPDPNEGTVDIPDFVVSSSQSSSSASGVFPMIKDCNGDGSGSSNPTPTPKASPTPTPKAARKENETSDCFNWLGHR